MAAGPTQAMIDSAARTTWEPVQRVMLPRNGDNRVLPLYVQMDEPPSQWSRTAVTLQAGAFASFASYFGAFPAAYWVAHTDVRRVRLTVTTVGAADLRVLASTQKGVASVVAEVPGADGTVEVEVELGGRVTGSVWFEVHAASDGTTIANAVWSVPRSLESRSTAAVCITSFDRPEDCVAVLDALAEDTAVLERVESVIVVDQGTARVRDSTRFANISTLLAPKLRVVEQPNLGGSGGFSRGMLAAAEGAASHALLLDDDVMLEPESILRMLCFADHANAQIIVGAHMLSLTTPTVLHSIGEKVDVNRFWWLPVSDELAPVDLAMATVKNTPALSRRYDVDFNGWWMCLVPTSVIREVGAALPFFIKWDDAEFGLRAAAAGVTTVALPGAALWHMPWTDKDDGLDWQAYFHLRNRLVTALLHSPQRRGTGVLAASLWQDVVHVLCLQYGSAALRRLAIRDVLSGPSHLPVTLRSRVPVARELLARAGQVVVPEERLPPAVSTGPRVRPPRGAVRIIARLAAVAWHQLRPTPQSSGATVDVALPREVGKWWMLGRLDSATVRSATGGGSFIARRSRTTAVALLRDAVVLRVGLWRQWPNLAAKYRRAAPELTRLDSWRPLFENADRTSA